MKRINTIVILLTILVSVLLTGCQDEKPYGNYKIFISNGWKHKTLYCDSYERNGYEIKCILNDKIFEELILSDDFDITITAVEFSEYQLCEK